ALRLPAVPDGCHDHHRGASGGPGAGLADDGRLAGGKAQSEVTPGIKSGAYPQRRMRPSLQASIKDFLGGIREVKACYRIPLKGMVRCSPTRAVRPPRHARIDPSQMTGPSWACPPSFECPHEIPLARPCALRR